MLRGPTSKLGRYRKERPLGRRATINNKAGITPSKSMWWGAVGLPHPQRVAIIRPSPAFHLRCAVGADDPGFDAAAWSLFNLRTDVGSQTGATNLFSSGTGHSGLQPKRPGVGCTTASRTVSLNGGRGTGRERRVSHDDVRELCSKGPRMGQAHDRRCLWSAARDPRARRPRGHHSPARQSAAPPPRHQPAPPSRRSLHGGQGDHRAGHAVRLSRHLYQQPGHLPRQELARAHDQAARSTFAPSAPAPSR